jgi:endo-1,4-beta-xylanase
MADKQFQLEEFKSFLDPYPNGLPDSMQTVLPKGMKSYFPFSITGGIKLQEYSMGHS